MESIRGELCGVALGGSETADGGVDGVDIDPGSL